jgi:hypothetical protein
VNPFFQECAMPYGPKPGPDEEEEDDDDDEEE